MKNHLILATLCVFFFYGCAGLHTPYAPPGTAKIDPVLSEDNTDESTPSSINFSESIKNFDPDNPDVDQATQDVFDQALDFCTASQEFWQKGDVDNALQSLDQAYSIILNIDPMNSPQLIKQKEDLRYMISKRILEIYASQNTGIAGTHKAIPIIINKDVQREIDSFTNQERDFFAESLRRSGKYRPAIVKMLKEAGIPQELSWLPLVESGFKVNALSRARALGLWQFIPSTGYMYGLKRDTYIDERLDPRKATLAAISYLKKMHAMFGDWSTVLAAYNCGEGRVLSTIRTQKINYLDNFWDLYGKLPNETARYVPRFIATVHIINNLKKYGFDTVEIDTPDDYETVNVAKRARLKDIAEAIEEQECTLRQLNPELRYGILPSDNYTLNIPKGKSEKLLASIDSLEISTPTPPSSRYIYHRVKFGETLSTISRKYNVSTRVLVKTNKISRRNFVDVGRIVKIPQKGAVSEKDSDENVETAEASEKSASSSRKVAKTSKSSSELATIKHVVRKGDSLFLIAKKYGTTVRKLKSQNHVTTASLKNGQVLTIPGKYSSKRIAAKSTTKSTASVYSVKKGDSTSSIASRHNMSVSRLLRLNKLSAKSKIRPGQQLFIE